MKKKDILITSPSINTSDNVSGIASLTRLLIENNMHVSYRHFITGKRDIESRNYRWLTRQFTLPFRFLFYLLRNFHIRICHFNIPQESYAIIREGVLVVVAKMFRKRVIVHLRGGKYNNIRIDENLVRIALRISLLLSDTIICLSQIEKTSIIHNYGIESRKIKVLPNAVAVNQTLNKAYGGILTILFLGRIDENKGFPEIITVLKNLHNKIDFKFILCGTGPLEQFLVQELSRCISNEFINYGVVTGEKKAEVFRNAHVFLLPSYYEGLPNALLEAMAFGVIPICTPVGSIPSVVKDGKNGFLVPMCDSKTIEEIIIKLNSNRKQLQVISENAYQYCNKNHSLSNYLLGLNSIYDELEV